MYLCYTTNVYTILEDRDAGKNVLQTVQNNKTDRTVSKEVHSNSKDNTNLGATCIVSQPPHY